MFVLRNLVPKVTDTSNIFKVFREMSVISNESVVNPNIPKETERKSKDGIHFSEEEIVKKRNKSRLMDEHRNLLNNELPYPEPRPYHDSVRFKSRMYGMYGDKSGVNPCIIWPSPEEIISRKEYESLARPHTLQEMVHINNERKIAEKEMIHQREEEVAKNMANLAKWKKELELRVKKKEDDAAAAKAKKDRLIEEVRRHFGFKVDPKDERFKEMLEKKEKEEKKLAKEAKRKAREAKMMSQLLEASGKSDVQKPS